jgi:hypothetical protein
MEKRKRRKRKIKREGRESRSRVAPLPLLVGPNYLVDDEGIPMLSSRLSLVPRVDVVGQSWRSIPPGWTVWSTDSSDRDHVGVGSIV